MEYIDSYLCSVWNKEHVSEKVVEENFWDFCRELEKEGYLIGDDASVTAISIGPFKMVSKIEVNRKDLLMFFLTTVVPAIYTEVDLKNLQFVQMYKLYLLPALRIFIKLADSCYWIKDLLQWKILMYVDERNKNGEYPTITEIKESSEFSGVEEYDIKNAVEELKKYKSLLGDKGALIVIDNDGRMKSFI